MGILAVEVCANWQLHCASEAPEAQARRNAAGVVSLPATEGRIMDNGCGEEDPRPLARFRKTPDAATPWRTATPPPQANIRSGVLAGDATTDCAERECERPPLGVTLSDCR